MASETLDPTLTNLFEQISLKWIFVGGKGGVGKTTCSSSIAVELARRRKSVLIISTDPAHNLSDAFAQSFTSEPTKVEGFSNLFAMEIDPAVSNSFEAQMGLPGVSSTAEIQQFMGEIVNAIPGIDEAMSFAELMRRVETMEFDVIVFDTAPTGHTLRLLGIPATLQKALDKVAELKSRFGGLFAGMGGLAGMDFSEEKIMGRLESARQVVAKVNAQFMDPEKTTFVCVCIPEFLSVYETERLVQELAGLGIDVHNIIINQVLIPEADSTCKKCSSRVKMQQKYINQVYALYDFFHLTVLPLLDEEVRGVPSLVEFTKFLREPIPFIRSTSS